MGSFVEHRDCEVEMEIFTEVGSKEDAEKLLSAVVDEFAKTYPKSDLDISINEYDEETQMVTYDVTYAETEVCWGDEGYKSRDWYEPDDPPYIDALDSDDKAREMAHDIEALFNKVGDKLMTAIADHEIVNVNIPSIESMLEDHKNYEPDYEPDYD